MSHGGWGTTRIKKIAQCHPEKRHYANELCRECYRLTPAFKATCHAYYVSHKAQYYEQDQRRRAEHRERAKAYGVPGPTIQAMLEAQGNRCALCGDPPKRKKLALDHDHHTGAMRAFLCHPCNGALGLFKDDITRLRKAIAYLTAHRRRNSVSAPAAPARPASTARTPSLRRRGVSSTLWQDGLGGQSPD